jgi:hypothetical protein
MDAETGKPLPAFGFLTVLESSEHGLFGGYLVLSPLGRPLEFRCSTPVAPSRAQQILYGPTLRPYLLAEVIGQALLAGSEAPVAAILTDQSDMLPLGLLRREPVAHVEPALAESVLERSQAGGHFDLVGCRVTPAEPSIMSIEAWHETLRSLVAHIQLCEPFDRVRAALAEAQLASHDAAEWGHDNSAAA